MKNLTRKPKFSALFGFTALMAVFALGLTSCDDGSGDRNQTPVAADYDIAGLEQVWDGSPKTVTVTPKQGKSKGVLSVMYDGETTAPTDAGEYAVTFNVGATTGWNAANGLSGGTLTIRTVMPIADDFEITGQSHPYDGNPKSVTIEPKDGKSEGALTIYYEGTQGTTYAKSTTAPSAFGTYTITFDVEAWGSWEAAEGLDGGIMIIQDPANPVLDDFNIPELTHTYTGNPIAITITAKEGKTEGDIIIKYDGITTAPTNAATYEVTIDVTQASGFNAITDLLIGNLVINKAASTWIAHTAIDTTYTPTLTLENINDELDTGYAWVTSTTSLTVAISGQQFEATYTESVNHNPTTGFITVNIKKADRAFAPYTAITGVLCTVGTLAGIPLNPNYEWVEPTTAVAIGTDDYEAKYIDPNGNYNDADGEISVTKSHDWQWLIIVSEDQTRTVSLVETCTVCADTRGVQTAIDSTAQFATVLASLPANTADTPYTILLNVDNLGGPPHISGSVGSILQIYNMKFVNLNLSGNTITSIAGYAFQDCSSLISITIPNSVTSIEMMAFGGCTSLTSITIPDSVETIGNLAFGGCTALTEINVDSGNTVYSSINGILFSKDEKTLIKYPAGKTETTFIIPDSVISIGQSAFSSTSLESVIIGSSVTSIATEAFAFIASLTSITIGNNVNSIDFGAFYLCENLTSVNFEGTIPSSGFHENGFFWLGDLRAKFYSTDSTNGTPGIYTTSNPVHAESVWTMQ